MNFPQNSADYEIVPFGLNCDVAHFLRANSLRRSAFPFDWNMTPVRSAIDLLANDFAQFLDDDNLIFLPPVQRMLFKEDGDQLEVSDEVITPVICRKYGMLFPHDFSSAGRLDLPIVQEKYSIRIQRLKNILKADREILFVVQDGALNDWQNDQYQMALGKPLQNNIKDWKIALAGVLKNKYKNLKFRLLDLSELKSLLHTG